MRAEIVEQLRVVFNSYTIHFLFIVMIIDILSGITKGYVIGKFSSNVGIKGLLKHCLVMITIIVISLYLPLMGYRHIALFMVYFFILQYSVSILENWGKMGLPAPKNLKERLLQLSSEIDKDIIIEERGKDEI